MPPTLFFYQRKVAVSATFILKDRSPAVAGAITAAG